MKNYLGAMLCGLSFVATPTFAYTFTIKKECSPQVIREWDEGVKKEMDRTGSFDGSESWVILHDENHPQSPAYCASVRNRENAYRAAAAFVAKHPCISTAPLPFWLERAKRFKDQAIQQGCPRR